MPRIPMAWQASVGGHIEYGAKVNACCSCCGLWRPVDLQALAERRGLDFSLWDKRSTCPTIDADGKPCRGTVFYHAAAGSISRPLQS